MIKTKRIWAVLLTACMLLTFAPMHAFASTTSGKCGENTTWIYDYDTGRLTISGMGDIRPYAENMEAPWYRFSNNITSVSIESGVTGIGDYAFLWCDAITSVSIPSTVKNIGSYAFNCCKALTSITIPDGVESISESAFENCEALTSVNISGSVKSIGKSAFSGCYISEEQSDDGIERGLEKVIIQEGVENIGIFAFNGCKKLKDVTLPDSLKSIGDNAFQYTKLYDVFDYSWDVCYIGNHVIRANENTISGAYRIRAGIKTIADNAFSACDDLTSIEIPDGVVSIGNHAFDGCKGITSINIPNSVTSIGNSAFSSCVSLTGISVSEGNASYCAENGVLYNKAKTKIIRFPCQKTDTSFMIPNGITSIADGAFENCRNLTGITIPDGVKSIGDSAFSNCQGLTSIIIPDGVKSLGNSAFYHCYFEEKDDKGSVISKGGLEKATIPNTVNSIGKNAFFECGNLSKVYYNGSPDDWNNITKGKNHSIDNNIITYCAGIMATLSADGKSIFIKPANIDTGKTVILALYNGDKFVEMQQSNEYSETNREITFIPVKNYTCARVMIWNSLSGISPVCDFKIIE